MHVHILLRTHNVYTLYLYKSLKTPSYKGRIMRVKYESLGQTTCCWVGQNKYNQGDNMCKYGKGSVWPEDEARMDALARCCGGQLLKYGWICTINPWCFNLLRIEECNVLGAQLICLFCPWVKNIPWHLWVYSWIRHRREQPQYLILYVNVISIYSKRSVSELSFKKDELLSCHKFFNKKLSFFIMYWFFKKNISFFVISSLL